MIVRHWRNNMLFSNRRKEKSDSNNSNDAVVAEVLSYIESVRLLFVGDPRLDGETLGCFNIVPINENNGMYKPDSCRVMLMVLLYDDYAWKIQSILATAESNDSLFGIQYHLENRDSLKVFVAYTAGRFKKKYKSFMSQLYKEVNNAYPGRFRLKDSQIISSARYGETLF